MECLHPSRKHQLCPGSASDSHVDQFLTITPFLPQEIAIDSYSTLHKKANTFNMHISPWNRYQPCHSPNWCPSEMDINPPWLVTSHITSWTLHLVTHTYISWTMENINKNIGISWVSYSGIYTTSTLKASRMNVNPGGSQAQMRDGWFQQNGKRIIQPMIFPADHPTFPNQPKGLWHVLAKWGIDTWHLSCAKCKKCELSGDAPSHTSAVPDSTPPLG